MPSLLGLTAKEEKRMKAVRKAKRIKRVRKKWVKAAKSGKYRGVGKVSMHAKALSWYISRGARARRKKLLKIVREMRLKSEKADVKKYIPKKYREMKR